VLATSQPVLLGGGAALESNLTGRRNIELGLLALGLHRDEAMGHVDEIADFADLDEFIDLPLKTYSSGMRARLHFSIASSIRPEILLIDEALAVGDQAFRKKSRDRIRELLGEAGTVFVVSHSLSTLHETCSRVVWIDKGRIVQDGAPDDVIEAYRAAS
jgi:teichoic acid transport system ATP-binding protein